MAATFILLLTTGAIQLKPLDNDIYKGAHIKLLSKEVALVGLGGPFGRPKFPIRSFLNT